MEPASQIVIDALSEPLKKSFGSVFDGVNEYVESIDVFNRYMKHHTDVLQATSRSIKILGMQSPVNIEDIYYPTHISTDIKRRIFKTEWADISAKLKSDSSKNLILADKFIADNKRVVILGGPGAGKTTFLKYLSIYHLDSKIFSKETVEEKVFPIYVHLPALGGGAIDILDHIASPLYRRIGEHTLSFYKRRLLSGNALVLFDSLDEVPPESKKAVVNALVEFSNTYTNCRVIISCRSADYNQSISNFVEVELAKLSPAAVKAIIKGWFKKEEKDKAERLISLIDQDRSIGKLTETPLLLGLLCIQYRNDLALPNRKTELYRRCVDALLRDWDASRNFRRLSQYSQLSDDRKEMIFESIAGATSLDSIEYEFSEAKALAGVSDVMGYLGLSALDSNNILQEIESHHGIVEKCSAESYQFSHGTMHEYFIARYFVNKRRELEIIKRNYNNKSWETVICFISSISPDPGSILNFLKDKSNTENFKNYPALAKKIDSLVLLYKCISMGIYVSPEIRSSLLKHVVDSQVFMLKQLNSDSVFPFASRKEIGVRQVPFFARETKSRATLNDVLLPTRVLMNEISSNASDAYAETVLTACRDIYAKNDPRYYGKLGILTSLLCPIADRRPKDFCNFMHVISNDLLSVNADSVRSLIIDSIAVQKKIHPNVQPDNDVFEKFAEMKN